MTAAAFGSVGLLLWSRNSRVLMGVGVAYAAVFVALRLWDGADFLAGTLRGAPLLAALYAVQPGSWLSMDFEGGRSLFPRQLLTLPATGRQLALPFIVYGAGTCAVFSAASWAAVQVPSVALEIGPARYLIYLLPFDWLLDIALVVWVLAVLWSTFARPLARTFAAFAVFACYLGLHFAARAETPLPDAAFVAVGFALVLGGSVFAVRAVEHARSSAPTSVPRTGTRTRAAALASPAGALVWLDRRVRSRRVWAFTLYFAVFGALQIFLAAKSGNQPFFAEAALRNPENAAAYAAAALNAQDRAMLRAVLTLSPWLFLLAFVVAAPVDATRGNRVSAPSSFVGLPPFLAALPVTPGDHAWARIKSSAVCMLAPALVWLAVIGACCWFAGVPAAWAEWLTAFRAERGALAVATLIGTAAVAAVALGLAASASSVWVALAGRLWVGIAFMIAAVGLAFFWHSLVFRFPRSQALLETLLAAMPFVAAAKLAAVAVLAYVVGVRRLYAPRRIAAVVGAWTAFVLLLLAAYVSVAPDAGVTVVMATLATLIVFTPILGILAAPLALKWGRVR